MNFHIKNLIGNFSPMMWGALSLITIGLTALLLTSYASKDDIESGVYRVLVRKNLSFGHGTGFKVSDQGHVLTNEHVVRGARGISLVFRQGDQIGSVPANIIWYNSEKDLALLEPTGRLPGFVNELADISQDESSKTETVTAVGFPGIADDVARNLQRKVYNADIARATLLDPTITQGSLQRFVQTLERLTIQHSATIRPGNSGGPLFDACGRIIGVNTLYTTTGYNFAVHITETFAEINSRDIRIDRSAGRCIGGFKIAEITSIGFMSFLSLAFAFTGIYVRSKQPEGAILDERIYTNEFDVPHDSFENGILGTAEIGLLKDPKSGQTYDLSKLGAISEAGKLPGELDSLTIGRSNSVSDIAISNSTLSRKHAVIGISGDHFAIQDLDTTNGTQIDGSSISGPRGGILHDGAIVTLGDLNLTFQLRAQKSVTKQATQQHLKHQDNKSRNGRRTELTLSGLDTGGKPIQFSFSRTALLPNANLSNAICVIGRGLDNSFTIADSTVSRQHAAICLASNGSLTVCDLGSSNGTFVNNKRIGSQAVPITTGNTLRLGKVKLSLQTG